MYTSSHYIISSRFVNENDNSHINIIKCYLIVIINLTSSTSCGIFAIGCVSGSRQRGDMAGDMMGCWNTAVTVVVEQREGAATDDTSIAVLLAPL